MRRVRSALISLVVLALAFRIIWWAIEPVLPFLLIALLLVVIIGWVWFRHR